MGKEQQYLKVGVLTETQNNDFPNELMQGILDAVDEENIILIRFMSLNPRDEQELYINKDILTHVIKSARLDGLLFLGWIYDFQGKDETFKFIMQFSDIPLVSMGKGYPEIPNECIYGPEAMTELIVHLIEVHGYKNIAFINPEIEDERFILYQKIMKERGLYKSELVIRSTDLQGIYFRRGEIALSLLLDKRKVKPDAVISLDENNAIAIVDDLKKRGIKVPQEMAVTSFEDGERGRYYHPSLTTIPYSFYDIGYHSCKKLIKILKKENYNHNGRIIPKVIFRRSCGCHSPLLTHFNTAKNRDTHVFHFPLTDDKKQELVKIIQEESGCSFTNQIVDSFILSVSNAGCENDIEELLSRLIEKFAYKEDIYILQQCISSLHNVFFPGFFKNQNEMFKAEQILHQCRIILAEAIESFIGKRLINIQLVTRLLLKLAREFGNAFDKNKLVQLLLDELPLLEIKSCYLSLYEGEEFPDGLYELYFAYKDHTLIPINEQEKKYVPDKLLPARYLNPDKKRIYVYQPMFFQEEFLGSLIFEPGMPDYQIYRVLSEMFSSALKGANLIKSLEKAYNEIKDAQKEIINKAHKAGMAEIVVSILHNIGNILNSISTSTYTLDKLLSYSPLKKLEAANILLKERLPDLEVLFKDDIKMSSLLKYYLSLESLFSRNYTHIEQQLNRINEHAEMLNRIIISQENFAGTKLILESIDIKEVINLQLNEFLDSFIQFDINVIKEFAGELPRVFIQKAKIHHILNSIISNAVEAVIENPEEQRNIFFILYPENRNVILKIKDTGCGMSGEIIQKIFQLGFSTKKKGSGFNLHYCANFLSEMKGKISAYSDGPGKGATFTLEFTADMHNK